MAAFMLYFGVMYLIIIIIKSLFILIKKTDKKDQSIT
jgi:hypothetical protein